MIASMHPISAGRAWDNAMNYSSVLNLSATQRRGRDDGYRAPAGELNILRIIAENSADVLSLHDALGRCRYISPNVPQLFGWKPGQLLGHALCRFIHRDDLAAVQREWNAQAQHGEVRLRYRLRCCSGDYRWVESRSRFAEMGRYSITITRDVHHDVEDTQQLRHHASHDALTDALNRRAFAAALESELQRSTRGSTSLSLAFFDVDRFKQINDNHGHEAGDEVLRGIARCVEANKRVYDVFGRWGGDEFVLLFPGTAPSEALQIIERIRQSAAQTLPGIGLSFGLASNADATDATELLALADAGLYKSKQAGGAKVNAWREH